MSPQNTNNTKTFAFGYDGASRLTNLVYPNGVQAALAYDAESRVLEYRHSKGASNLLRHVILRDPRGYKTQEDNYAGLVPNFTNGLHQTRTHNDADQLIAVENRQSAITNQQFSYDSNGNLTNSARGTYAWDYDNRLIATPGVQYLYDASGVRVGRIAGVSPAVTNYFVVDYADPLKRPLCETDAFGNATRYYVWAGFRLLAHIEANETVRYYHGDELGSTLALSDSVGNVTDQFAYSPYGQLLSRTGTNNTAFQWLGGYGVFFDASANLHLTLHRAYSADMRRFISADPMGIDGGVNLYAYGNLNPLFFVDPYGLCADGGDPWYTQAAGWLSRNAPHSVALVGGGTAEAGWGSGGGGQAASGVGLFTGTGIGAFTESGGFASSEPDASTRQFVFGATAGVGAGPFISNASNPQQLLGPFDTMTLNLPLVSIQVAGDGKIWTATVSVGRSYGLSVSRYSVTTTTATGSK